jgi:pyruvate, orthophosphate dikinase
VASRDLHSVILIDGDKLPDRQLVGAKAWSIASMRSLGLSVPSAFVIPTRCCQEYFEANELPGKLVEDIHRGILWLEQETARQFGRGPRPLLVSVRSGASVSMPGMMDTILNLGISPETEPVLAEEWADTAFARDVHRRFWHLFGKVVLHSEPRDSSGSPAEVRQEIEQALGRSVATDVTEQLLAAIKAVFDSWNSPRAKRYRKHQNINNALGTAVTVQAMVFGNADAKSGTGVLFSRNPVTGEAIAYGEYLARAQGEDVVSGFHTPMPLESLGAQQPDMLQQLLSSARALEQFHKDAQDIEFTVERGRLFFLQTRSAKCAPYAAIRIAESMVGERLIDIPEAIRRVTPEQVRLLLTPRLADGAADGATILAKGEAASPGIGQGRVVLQSDLAESMAKEGTAVVLARATTSPEDLHGMLASVATVTEQGGTTSHAAVVARALGKPCVVGCGTGTIDALAGRLLTVDGGTGSIYDGLLGVLARREEDEPAFARLLEWCEQLSPVRVRAEPPGDMQIVDLDRIDNPDDLGVIEAACAAVPEGCAARGTIFSTNSDAMEAAIRAHITTIVTYPRLPALLAAARYHLSQKGIPHVEPA